MLKSQHVRLNLIGYKLIVFILFLSLFMSFPARAQDEAEPVQILSVGIAAKTISGVALKDAELALETWGNSLRLKEDMTKFETKITLYEDLDELKQALNQNAVDLIILLSTDFLRLNETVKMIPFFCPTIQNEPLEKYALLVHNDSGIKNLNQLKNKKLIIQSGGRGEIAMMWLDTVLLQENLPESKNFFHSIKRVDKVSQAVLPIFFRQADVCAVPLRSIHTMIELNPQIEKKTTAIALSPGFLYSIVSFRYNYDETYKKEIGESALRLHTHPDGKQILTLFHHDRALAFQPEFLNNVRTLVREYDALKNR